MDKYNKRLHSYQKFLDKFSIEKDRNISDDMKRKEFHPNKRDTLLNNNINYDLSSPNKKRTRSVNRQLVDICPITVAGQPENLVMYTSPSVCNSDANHTERRLIRKLISGHLANSKELGNIW
ncbi:403_t:CDS:2 [Rhizophagus irregularis]|nr:403_t:CDS:2 [Rhizophagus irregularis]